MTGQPPYILAVDDDTALLELLYDALSFEDYLVETCISGLQALRLMRLRQPDLIVLDIYIERPNAGLLVLGEMSQDPQLAHIPVVVCSTNTRFIRDELNELPNVRSIVEKPFDIRMLIQTIAQILSG